MTAILEGAKELVVEKWGTLNTATSPQKLPDGHSPNNQNVWMDEKPGSVVTANGYTKLGQTPSGNPTTLLLNYFKTSDGSSQLIVSDNATVWYTTDYVNYTQIITGLSGFFQLRGAVIRDKVWLTNGSDPVMTWNGTTLTELDGNGGTPNVPLGKYIAFHDERVFIYGINGDLSSLRFSALANSSGTEIAPDNASAWPSDNELQISEGDADQGTGIFVYRGYLYCSKQYSIWRIVGYDEYTYSRVKTRASTGTRFQESIQIKDNLVHFIGVDGLYVFDGEEATRISDIIDPSSAEEGVFAFRNLQQPLLNTQFWNVSETVDFNAGTVPNNISTTDDKLSLVPADDTQADFNLGTHDDTTADDNPGYLQLGIVSAGSVGSLISELKPASLATSNGSLIGIASYISDGSQANVVGSRTGAGALTSWAIDLQSSYSIGRAIIRKFYAEGNLGSGLPQAKIQYSSDNTNWSNAATISSLESISGSVLHTSGSGVYGGLGPPYYSLAEADYTVDFSTITARYWRILIQINGGNVVIKDLEFYIAGYEADGKFVSKPLDMGTTPNSFGALAATITTNGENYQFFTQSSDDGSTWDSEVNVSNGGSIGSTLRRYLRWGVYLYSSTGSATPIIDKVYVGSTYISEIHDAGGNILQWGGFQASFNKAGQTVTLYFRAASTQAGVSLASWTEIVSGAIPNTAITNRYVQIRVFMSTTSAVQAPLTYSFTVNWILSSSSGAAVLQNVASFVWLNRYWLAAATLGADENDTVIVLGKSTFESPWHKKDFKLLSFCRFQDVFIAGSSEDGSIYRLESGYSKNGSAMDAFYETRDFSDSDFILKGKELIVSTDRLGPYDLSVGWSTDGGETWTETTIDLTRDTSDSVGFSKKLNINFMSDSVRFRVRINGADKPFVVDGLRCYYRPSPQRGSIGS